jgi:hypothetical protein
MSFITFTHPHIPLGRSNQGNEVDGACGTHGRERKVDVLFEIPKERDHLEDRGIDEKMESEWILAT